MKNKLLSSLMVALFALSSMFTVSMKADVNVYVYSTESTAPWLWVWTSSGSNLTGGSWPGKQMTEKAQFGDYSYYKMSFAGQSNLNVIINNGNTSKMVQTSDIEGVNGDVYYYWQPSTPGKYAVINDPTNPDNVEKAPTSKIYWDNSKTTAWSVPYFSAWLNGVNIPWPGEPMTKVSGVAGYDNLWVIEVPEFTSTKGLWVNSTQTSQTVDVDGIEPNYVYQATSSSSKYTVAPIGIFNESTNTVDPIEESDPTLWVIGTLDIGSWNPTKGYELTYNADTKTFAGDFVLVGDHQFSFASQLSSSESDWGGLGARYCPDDNQTITLSATNNLTSGNTAVSWNISETRAAKYNVTVNWEAKTFVVTFVEYTDVTVPTTLYVIGSDDTTWDIVNGLAELTAGGDDTFTGNLVLEGYETYYFRLAENLGSTNEDWAGLGTQYGSADGNGTAVTLSEAMDFAIGENTWTLAGGNYTITVSFEDMTVTIEGTANVKPEYQASGEMYIQGIQGEFSSTEAPQMEGSDGVFTYSGALFTEENNYFNFCDALGTNSDWDAEDGLNNVANRFGPATPNVVPEDGDDNEVTLYQAGVDAKGCLSWQVEAGKYDITLNLNTMNMVITKVEEPTAPTVTATPDAGTYQSAQEVTLTATPELSLIYYTTDGTEPTQDTQYLYESPITVDQSMTIKVMAVSPYNLTSTTEFAYTIDTTAIESIVGDNAEGTVEVYDLSGRQVKADTLKPGMYIIRRGGEAQKVLVK